MGLRRWLLGGAVLSVLALVVLADLQRPSDDSPSLPATQTPEVPASNSEHQFLLAEHGSARVSMTIQMSNRTACLEIGRLGTDTVYLRRLGLRRPMAIFRSSSTSPSEEVCTLVAPPVLSEVTEDPRAFNIEFHQSGSGRFMTLPLERA